MEKYFILIILFFSIPTKKIISQTRFSQFYSTPLLYNPANTGRFNKSQRIGGAFRTEKNYAGAYYQSTISFDAKVLKSKIAENDCLAFGIVGLNERSISDGLKNDYILFSFAYQKGLDFEGEQQIGVGFQTTLGRKRIEPPSYFFESQINTWIQSGFSNIDIFQFQTVNISYIDLNVGVVYQWKINPKNYFSVSGTIHHANRPSKSVQGGEFILNKQLGGHLAWENRHSKREKIFSYFFLNFIERKSNFSVGTIYQANIKSNNYHINIGASISKNFLKGEFFTPIIGLMFKELIFKISYDFPISTKINSLKEANEITLTYKKATSRSSYLEDKFIRY